MNFERGQAIIANYNNPPCWKKRVAGAFICALGVTITVFQIVAALGFIF